MKKPFYLFSLPWKRVKIYFDDKQTLDTELFKSLASKTMPMWYIKRRRALPNIFFKKIIDVREENTFLMYEGYDSTIFFYKEGKDIKVLRKKDEKYFKEGFLGYPIHWDFTLDYIPNKELLIKVLKNHWEDLKKGKKLHGDFTHYNILVDEGENVSFIDEKELGNDTPIIFDLFYFYSYFLHRADMYGKRDVYERELEDTYSIILKNEKRGISQSLDKIIINDFHFSKKEETFQSYKGEFEKLLDEIIK